jgi:hypothetical protein
MGVIRPAPTLDKAGGQGSFECIICRINCATIDRGTRCSAQKRDLGDPSLALSDGCNGFRTRSLKLASNRANRHTLKAAPAAAIVVSESGATGETKKAAQRFSAIER